MFTKNQTHPSSERQGEGAPQKSFTQKFVSTKNKQNYNYTTFLAIYGVVHKTRKTKLQKFFSTFLGRRQIFAKY